MPWHYFEKAEVIQAFMTSSIAENVFSELALRGVKVASFRNDIPTAWSYLLSSLRESGVTNLEELEVYLQNIGENHYRNIVDIADMHYIAIGRFTLLRDAVVAQLPIEQRARVIERVPTGSTIQAYERAVFLKEF